MLNPNIRTIESPSMRRVVVCRQQILAKVVGVVAENRVDVVGAVLRVVVLDDKAVVSDVVVVALEALQRTCPCEVDAVPTLAFKLVPVVHRHLVCRSEHVVTN